MKAHDLNAMTWELMRSRNVTWREARAELGRRGARTGNANRRTRLRTQAYAAAVREREERISP